MGKHSDRKATAEQEFASLELLLNNTADEASRSLKLLKKNLSDYDSRHGNHFTNTATSYMRGDMRTAKDTANDLKHVAHQIKKSSHHSEAEVTTARSTMDNTAKAMDLLKTTARNYDRKNGRSKGVKGAVDNALGQNDKERHEKEGRGFFGKSEGASSSSSSTSSDDTNREKEGGLFGKKHKHKEEKQTGLFGKDKEKENKSGGLFGSTDKDTDEKHSGGLFGKGEKDNQHGHDGGVFEGKDPDNQHGHGGVLSADTVEDLVKTTLRDNFNLSALSHQITLAEKSLTSSPSFIERAKEAVHEVKEKIKGGDKSSPTRLHHDTKHAVTP